MVEKTIDKNAEGFYAVTEKIAINKTQLPKEWLLCLQEYAVLKCVPKEESWA